MLGTQLSLLYQTRIQVIMLSTLLFSKNEYSHIQVSMPINSSETKWNSQNQVQRKGLTPMSASNPCAYPFLLCSVQFPQCNCQYSEECRNGKNAHCTWLIAWQTEKPKKTLSWELIFIIFPVAAQSWMLLWFISTILKSLGICNMFRNSDINWLFSLTNFSTEFLSTLIATHLILLI